MKKIVFLFFLNLSIAAVAADSVCRLDYFPKRDQREQMAKVEEELDSLPPLILDVSNPKEALRKLIQEIQELHPDFSEIVILEKLLESGEANPEIVKEALLEYKEKAIQKAKNLIDKLNNVGLTTKERKILEGYRILLNKMNLMDQRADEIAQAQQDKETPKEDVEKEDPKKESQSKDDPSDKNTKEKQDRESDENNDSDQKENSDPSDSNKEQDSQESSDKDKDSKDKEQQQKDDDKSQQSEEQDASKDSEKQLEQQVEDLKKKIEEKIKEQQQKNQEEQKKKRKEKEEKSKNSNPDQKNKEKRKEKNKPQDKNQDKDQQDGESEEANEKEQQQGQQKDSEDGKGNEDQQGKEGDGKTEGQDGKPSKGKGQKGKPSNEPGEDGPGEASDGSTSDSKNSTSQSKNPSKKKPTQKSSSKAEQEASGESGSSNSQDENNSSEVAKKLAEHFKDLLKSKKEAQADGETVEDSKKQESSQTKEADAKTLPETDVQKQAREAVEKKREEQQKKKQEAERKRTQQTSAQAEKSKLDPMTPEQNAEFLKDYMNQLWAETLRNYTEHSSLMSSLSHFRSVADALLNQYPSVSFLKQYASRAHAVFEELDSAQIHYKNLDHLGVSFIGDEAGTHVLRKLRFIIRLLESIQEVSQLTAEEDATLSRAYELFAQKKLGGKKNYEKEIGQAFVSQMTGPLSRLDLKTKFPSQDPREEYDWAAMAKAIKAGELNDLIGFSRVKSYLNMFNRRTFKPKQQKTYTGPKVPINESEPQLDLADDLDRLPYFHRDGTHPKDDLLRLISGDMLENIYPDEKLKNNPKQKIPKVVTIIVFDISGSMSGDKDKIRNTLIGAYLDKTQIDTVTGRADHVYYFIPFDSTPRAAERVADFRQAKEYFQRFRNYPPSSGGGTEITKTLISVYESIAKHQEQGGELDYANILFLTDGEAELDVSRIEVSRKKINPDVDIILNAITLGDKNKQVEKLAKENGDSGNGKLGRVFHQHLEMSQIKTLLEQKQKMEHLEKIADEFDSDSDAHFRKDLLMKLKTELAKLSSQREMQDRNDSTQTFRLIRDLEKSTQEGDSTLKIPIAVFLSTMDGAISQGWNTGRRGDVLLAYLETLAQIYKMSSTEIMERLDSTNRSRLIAWLRKN